MGNHTSIERINFEDIQETIRNKEKYIIINTLPNTMQECLLINTINYIQEEQIINGLIKNNANKHIIVYGKNANDTSIYDKYEQLIKLGFNNVFVYTGGMFEWLCLQDIYGEELFPTTKKELDILKYKSITQFSKLYLLDYTD
jgi:hypothetical protein